MAPRGMNPKGAMTVVLLAVIAGGGPMMLASPTPLAAASQVDDQAQAGWKTVKDRRRRCQASVPADWTIGTGVLAGSATASNYRTAVVLAGVQEDPQKPMSAERLHELGSATVFENTPKRTFFASAATKPSGKVPSQIKYTAQVSGRPACTVQITVPKGQDDALAKRIAGTVGPAK